MAAYDKAITRDVQLIYNGITKKKKKKWNQKSTRSKNMKRTL